MIKKLRQQPLTELRFLQVGLFVTVKLMTRKVSAVTENTQKIGMPKSAPTAAFRLPLSALEAIDIWAKLQDDEPSRFEASRQKFTDYSKSWGAL